MIQFDDIRRKAERLWTRQLLLRDWLEPAGLFPYRIPAGAPGGRQLTGQFNAVKLWITHLESQTRSGFEIETKAIHHQQLGAQRLPTHVVIPSRDACLRLTRKQKDFERFVALHEQTLRDWPSLGPVLHQRPLEVLDAGADWGRLLDICRYFTEHPRPNLYLRQLDIPGVDTKFIERHRRMVRLLLDAILPADAIDADATRNSATGFAQRFGLRTEPPRLRLRILDPACTVSGMRDLEIPITDLCRLPAGINTVFVTENKTNGLCFPDHPNAIVIFGLGYAVDALKTIDWLNGKRIYYWGDIDTHGFRILNLVRKCYPDVQSILMDESTLREHLACCVEDPIATRYTGDLPHLVAEEQATYRCLLDNHYGTRLRLEQELIRYPWLNRSLSDLGDSNR